MKCHGVVGVLCLRLSEVFARTGQPNAGCVQIESLAVPRQAFGVGCLRGEDFTCSNYGMWREAFPYRT